MAGFLQAVRDKVGAVKTRVTWSYIKTHLTKDKIIVFILIALLWGLSAVSLFFIFLSRNEGRLDTNVNMTERDPGCNFTRENTTVKDCIYKNFYFEESTNLCAPNCYTWTSYAPATSAAIDGLVLFCNCIATLALIAGIAIAVIRRKAVFHFPSVLVFYMSLSSLIAYGTYLIAYIDKSKLFCSSMNMVENFLSPTPFCMLSGVVLNYCAVQLYLWVFFHSFSIYFLLFHPLRAKQLLSSSKLKYIHLCVVLVSLLVPLLTLLTTILHNLATEKDLLDLSYRIVLYSPHLCLNVGTKIPFYTIFLPSGFLLAMSISFLILVLWKLSKKKQLTQVQVGTVEKKILVTLCYYTLINITHSIINVIPASAYKFNHFEQEQLTFFKCASVEGVIEQLQIQNVLNPAIMTLIKILETVFPLLLLVYVVDCQKLKKCMMEKTGMAFLRSTKTQISSIKSP